MIAIVTDVHFGCRGDSANFHEYMEEFFKVELFPTLRAKSIKTVVCLGDLFDVRKTVSLYTLSRVKSYFFDVMRDEGIEFITIAGNHDVYFKNDNAINSPSLLLKEYSNVRVISGRPEQLMIDGVLISAIPWINNSNLQSTLDYISKDSATACFAHLELKGFVYQAGVLATHGMSASVFENYATVLTGHYHSKSSINNVHYLGSPFEMTWADANECKYWHTFDCTTNELTPIKSLGKMFSKLTYDDSIPDFEVAISEYDFASLQKKYVKVVVNCKTNPVLFDSVLAKISDMSPHDLSIVDNSVFGGVDGDDMPEFNLLTQTTSSILKGAVDSVNTPGIDQGVLYDKLLTVYAEASAIC